MMPNLAAVEILQLFKCQPILTLALGKMNIKTYDNSWKPQEKNYEKLQVNLSKSFFLNTK